MRKGLIFGTLLILVALMFSGNTTACWLEFSPMIAGQHEEIGEVGVGNYLDGDILYVKYEITEDGWEIVNIHLAVFENFDDIPTNKKGSPKIGKFPYKATAGETTDECWYSTPTLMKFHIPMADDWDSGDTLYIAAHSVVRYWNGETWEYETSWADTGLEFDGGSWALYFTYTVV